jgi:hypothetical protein
MSDAVSEHQVRVYEYGKALGGRWFTIQDLSTDTNIPDASAKEHAVRFEELGIFDRLRASPAHLFRLSQFASSRDPKTVRRLDDAIPIFAERRRERLRREVQALGFASRAVIQKPPVVETSSVQVPDTPVCEPLDALPLHGSMHPLASSSTQSTAGTTGECPVFTFSTGGASARARQIEGGFVVLAGSTARATSTATFQAGYRALRERLVAEGSLVPHTSADLLTFLTDTVFASPSAAAAVVAGRSASGPIEWKILETGQPYRDWRAGTSV